MNLLYYQAKKIYSPVSGNAADEKNFHPGGRKKKIFFKFFQNFFQLIFKFQNNCKKQIYCL